MRGYSGWFDALTRKFRIAQCYALRNKARMTLDTYLTQTGRTGTEFATAAGLTEASVSRIRKGQQNLSRDVMRRIIAASEQQVTAEGLVNALNEEVSA